MLATPYLFDRVFIGPSQITLDVFQNIVNHADLSRHVKTLVYDAVYFKNFSDLESYTREFEHYCNRRAVKGAAIDRRRSSSIGELERCILLLYGGVNHTNTFKNTDSPFSGDELAKAADAVAAGFQRWKNERAQQLHIAETCEMHSWLTLAFCKLQSLSNVGLQTYWGYGSSRGSDETSLLSVLPNSGPLARSWRSFYLPPGQPEDKREKCHAIRNIISTLAVSGKCIQTWNLTQLTLALHISSVQKEFGWGPMMVDHWSLVVASLTHLTVRLYDVRAENREGRRRLRSIDLLTASLAKGSRLQYLDITIDRLFSPKDADCANYYPLDDFFRGSHCTFTSLKTLRIRGFRATAENFISFFSAQPALLLLDIGALCFMDGINDGETSMGSLWALINGVCQSHQPRNHQTRYWSLEPPLFEAATGCLIPKQGLMRAAWERKIREYINRRSEAAKLRI
ncbi:MAG: hypothetical protein Q9225_004336 [Loekoesia sp. 1 TL-2023]